MIEPFPLALARWQPFAERLAVFVWVARLQIEPASPSHAQHQTLAGQIARDPPAARLGHLVVDARLERHEMAGVDDQLAVELVGLDRAEGVDEHGTAAARFQEEDALAAEEPFQTLPARVELDAVGRRHITRALDVQGRAEAQV